MSYESYLAHHGIKGMHWGIRRFQNTDGSLTGAGRKRYGVLDKTREKISGAVSRHKEKQLKQAKALEDAYVSKGMSREKAAKKVETRRKIERALMIAGTGLYGLGMMKANDINAINEAKLKANKKSTNGGSRNVRKKKRR